jgi:hypothetical protein
MHKMGHLPHHSKLMIYHCLSCISKPCLVLALNFEIDGQRGLPIVLHWSRLAAGAEGFLAQEWQPVEEAVLRKTFGASERVNRTTTASVTRMH